jgi:hypothetical protein
MSTGLHQVFGPAGWARATPAASRQQVTSRAVLGMRIEGMKWLLLKGLYRLCVSFRGNVPPVSRLITRRAKGVNV